MKEKTKAGLVAGINTCGSIVKFATQITVIAGVVGFILALRLDWAERQEVLKKLKSLKTAPNTP